MSRRAGAPDPRAFAALLCDWCLEVGPGQQVLVASTALAEPLLVELHRAILEREAWPLLRMAAPGLDGALYRHARGRQLDAPAPAELAEMQAIDSFLRIDAPANTAALADVDPTLQARVAAGRRALSEVRMSKRWCGSIWPTPALAQHAGMADDEYATFLARALFLDRADPMAAWRELRDRQQALVDRLAPARRVRIRADGTDLTLDVADRTWINSDGRRNMPSGEVFTSPREDGAEGTIRFTVPTGPRGVVVRGVELRFEAGRVVEASAQEGDAYLQAALATDDGARVVGELGIGTNAGVDRATGHILLDEKMAGTVHVAIGRSYPEAGGRNESALHWDLICDLRGGGEITVDGAPLARDGRLPV